MTFVGVDVLVKAKRHFGILALITLSAGRKTVSTTPLQMLVRGWETMMAVLMKLAHLEDERDSAGRYRPR